MTLNVATSLKAKVVLEKHLTLILKFTLLIINLNINLRVVNLVIRIFMKIIILGNDFHLSAS